MGLRWPAIPVGQPVRDYLLTLCVTAAVTYLLTGPVRKFAIAAGAMPEIRARDVHREPTPRLGGIAMFFGLCAGLLVADHLHQPEQRLRALQRAARAALRRRP